MAESAEYCCNVGVFGCLECFRPIVDSKRRSSPSKSCTGNMLRLPLPMHVGASNDQHSVFCHMLIVHRDDRYDKHKLCRLVWWWLVCMKSRLKCPCVQHLNVLLCSINESGFKFIKSNHPPGSDSGMLPLCTWTSCI